MDSPDPLDDQIRSWQPSIEPDPELKRQVMQRIAWEEEAARIPWHRRTVRRSWSIGPLAAGALAACTLLFAGLFTGLRWARHSHAVELARQESAYRLLIDPVSRAETENGRPSPALTPGESVNLVTLLAWMQEKFDLDRDQFLAVVALHQTYRAQFEEMYAELSTVERTYKRFEARRAADEMVDFMALYDLLERRKGLIDDAHSTSAELVNEVLALLDPRQGEAYLSFLEQATPGSHAS